MKQQKLEKAIAEAIYYLGHGKVKEAKAVLKNTGIKGEKRED